MLILERVFPHSLFHSQLSFNTTISVLLGIKIRGLCRIFVWRPSSWSICVWCTTSSCPKAFSYAWLTWNRHKNNSVRFRNRLLTLAFTRDADPILLTEGTVCGPPLKGQLRYFYTSKCVSRSLGVWLHTVSFIVSNAGNRVPQGRGVLETAFFTHSSE